MALPPPTVQVAAKPVRSLRAGLALVAVAAASCAVPFFSHIPETGMTLSMVAVIVAAAVAAKNRNRLDLFEVFFPFAGLYVTYFGVGSIYLASRTEALPRLSMLPYIRPALALGLVGFIAFAAGYFTTFRSTAPTRFRTLRPNGWSTIVIIGGLGFVGSLASRLQEKSVLSTGTVSAGLSLLQQLGPLFLFAWILAWYDFFWGSERRSSGTRALLILAPAALLVAFLNLGGKSHVLTIVGLPLIAFWYARRRVPIKALASLLLLAVFVIFPIFNTFRNQESSLGTMRRLDRTLNTIEQWDTRDYVDHSVFDFMGRMSLVSSVAAVIQWTGRWVNYQYGETILVAPVSIVVPRFLWPDKPNLAIARDFGVTFGLVTSVDKLTKIAPTCVGDFYWNFHIPGVLVGMFLFGAGYRWIYRKYGGLTGYEPVRLGIYSALLVDLMHFEDGVATVVGATARMIILFTVLIAALRRVGLLEDSSPPSATIEGPKLQRG